MVVIIYRVDHSQRLFLSLGILYRHHSLRGIGREQGIQINVQDSGKPISGGRLRRPLTLMLYSHTPLVALLVFT